MLKMFYQNTITFMKSQKQLESFTAYCKMYPDLRFWQALCNWSGYSKILGINHHRDALTGELEEDREDTYYKD